MVQVRRRLRVVGLLVVLCILVGLVPAHAAGRDGPGWKPDVEAEVPITEGAGEAADLRALLDDGHLAPAPGQFQAGCQPSDAASEEDDVLSRR